MNQWRTELLGPCKMMRFETTPMPNLFYWFWGATFLIGRKPAMAESTACGNCGEPLTEPANTAVDQRQPCPKCGSTCRSFSAEMTGGLKASGTFTLTVITYPKALLTIAQGLIDQGHFNIAIVTSHMACEVAAERAFDAAYAAMNLIPLGDAVDALMNGHNLGSDRHRKLYNALSGTKLEDELFWSRFKAASEKRNAIVHKGGHATQSRGGSCGTGSDGADHSPEANIALRARYGFPEARQHSIAGERLCSSTRSCGRRLPSGSLPRIGKSRFSSSTT